MGRSYRASNCDFASIRQWLCNPYASTTRARFGRYRRNVPSVISYLLRYLLISIIRRLIGLTTYVINTYKRLRHFDKTLKHRH